MTELTIQEALKTQDGSRKIICLSGGEALKLMVSHNHSHVKFLHKSINNRDLDHVQKFTKKKVAACKFRRITRKISL